MLYGLGYDSVTVGDATDQPEESAFSRCAFAIHYAPVYSRKADGDGDDTDCRIARFLALCEHMDNVVVVASCTVLLASDSDAPLINVKEEDSLPSQWQTN